MMVMGFVCGFIFFGGGSHLGCFCFVLLWVFWVGRWGCGLGLSMCVKARCLL